MYSFYGGKLGRTYNIVLRYDTLYINFADPSYEDWNSTKTYTPGLLFKNVNNLYKVLIAGQISDILTAEEQNAIVEIKGMVNKFQLGGSYTRVNYGLYVIIDTILNLDHQNDDINGLLYRRGFDYTEDANRAIRPVRSASLFWKEIEGNTVFDEAKWTAAWRNYVTRPGGGAEYVGQIVGPQGTAPQLRGISWLEFQELDPNIRKSVVEMTQTKGYDPERDPQFIDVIKLGYTDVIDLDGTYTGSIISFDIPYTITDFNLISTNPYVSPSIVESSASTSHPFYYKWDLSLPGGKHGTDLQELKVELGSATSAVLDGDGNLIQPNDYYVTYSLQGYDVEQGSSTQHLGRFPWRVINNIVSNYQEKNYFTWPVDEETANATEGDFYPIEEYNIALVCIQHGTVLSTDLPSGELDAGTVILGAYELDAAADWIVIDLESEFDNQITVDYKAGNSDVINFRQINYLTMDAKGQIWVSYTYNEKEEDDETDKLILLGSFKSISGLRLGSEILEPGALLPTKIDDNKLQILYLGDTEWSTLGQIKEVKKINFHNRLDQNQKITAIYKGADDTLLLVELDISQEMNMVVAIERVGDNIAILYSNPKYRKSLLTATPKPGCSVVYYERPYDGILSKSYDDDGNEIYSGTIGGQKRLIYHDIDTDEYYYMDGLTRVPSSGSLNPLPDDLQPYGLEYDNSTNKTFYWLNFGTLGSQYHVFGDYTVQQVLDYIPNGFDAEGANPEQITDSSITLGDYSDRAGWIISVTEGSGSSATKNLYAYNYHGNYQGDSNTYISGTPSGASEPITTLWYKLKELDESSINPLNSVVINDEAPTSLNNSGLWFQLESHHSHDL